MAGGTDRIGRATYTRKMIRRTTAMTRARMAMVRVFMGTPFGRGWTNR
jgi:hypothetical protein